MADISTRLRIAVVLDTKTPLTIAGAALAAEQLIAALNNSPYNSALLDMGKSGPIHMSYVGTFGASVYKALEAQGYQPYLSLDDKSIMIHRLCAK